MTVWLVDPISYTGMAYYDAALADGLTRLGARVTVVGSDRWMLPGLNRTWHIRSVFRGTSGAHVRATKGLQYLRALLRLVLQARRLRPDIIHWQYLELPLLDVATIWVLRRLGIRLVYTAHELMPWNARPYHRQVLAAIYRIVDLVVVHAAAEAQELDDVWHVPVSRIAVTGHGDYAMFATPGAPQAEARARLNLTPERPIALFFGSLRRSKGLMFLLMAWEAVIREVPEALLVVAGRPYKRSDEEAIRKAADAAGITANVDFRFGEIPPARANDYYRAADVVALPYQQITTSGVLRYAYSSGRTVVATALGEHVQWVVPGKTGWLATVDSAESMAQSLVEALRDRAQCAELGSNALKLASEYFRWSDIAGAMLQAYETILGESGTKDG